MKPSNRRLGILVAIAIVVIVLLTLLLAPSNNKLSHGSTYSRAPEGYAAWYAFMEKRGTPVQRWQKPSLNLAENQKENAPIVLLRVNSQIEEEWINNAEEKWVEKGNTLAILGVKQPVTKANFSTKQESPAGLVKIETRRRQFQNDKNLQANKTIETTLLGDRFGSVVWQRKIGKGQLILATTPYLAANAYQNEPGNYEFLAQLLTRENKKIWVDEYIHGYTDPDTNQCSDDPQKATEGNSPPRCSPESPVSLFDYLAKTPLTSALLQTAILLLVLLWAQNRRFGQPKPLEVPVVDNSQAYIQALAGVLQKAESSEFVADILGKEEQLQLQKALGLGQVPMPARELAAAWAQQTGRAPAEIEQLLQKKPEKFRISSTELLNLLEKWQTIRQHSGSATAAEIRGKGD